MKKLFLFLCAYGCFSQVSAQRSYSQSNAGQVKYTVTDQEAPNPWLNLSVDLVQVDMGIDNIDGASFNLGFHGYVDPLDFVGLDYAYRRSVLTGNFTGSNSDLEVGGHFFFQDKVVERKTKIILDYEERDDYSEAQTQRVISSTTIHVPAERRILRGLRGGMIRKSGPLGISDVEGVIEGEANLTSTGFYVGGIQRTLINVFADVEGYGEQFNSGGRAWSVDVLIYPTHTLAIENLKTNGIDAAGVEETFDGGSLGFRVMYDLFQIAPKKKTGKLFGMSVRIEAGSKPYQGFYVGGSWGLTILKMNKRPW